MAKIVPACMLFLLFCAGAVAAEDGDAAPPLQLPPGYALVWADEFDGEGLPDPARWRFDTERNRQGWFNNERQYYAVGRRAVSDVRDGQLLITARKLRLREADDWGGQRYTSARLTTQSLAAWTYGYVEVRAKLPCARGTWPAIWMLGTEGDWPDRGELDIMEHVGNRPGRVFSTVHTRSGHGGQGVGADTQVPTACSRFHHYQMWWTPESVRFGVDGREHARYINQGVGPEQWPFNAPQFLILNIAVGGDLGGAVVDGDLPATMAIDYVRVYQAIATEPLSLSQRSASGH